MAIRPFKYYLHGHSFYEYWGDLCVDMGMTDENGWTDEMRQELEEKVGRPFYEVTLQCELNDETGEVKILSAKG